MQNSVSVATLPAFTAKEAQRAKLLLATQVATMMGRKLEEDDWTKVYRQAKGIPESGWSNLHIDVNYEGLGLEMKLLRVAVKEGCLKTVCGTTLMHPAATRSIRIEDVSLPAEDVAKNVFEQYADLIEARTTRVKASQPGHAPDMRTGWLIWEESLTEFLYFEERMRSPNPAKYFAQWNETRARGMRKSSKSLWIYDKATKQKRYSVTTSAGIKIQPYFDVPPPSDPNLYYFRVQSEPLGADIVQIWVSCSTATQIRAQLGNLEQQNVSQAIIAQAGKLAKVEHKIAKDEGIAQPIQLSRKAFEVFEATWDGVSDEHRAQLFLESLRARN